MSGTLKHIALTEQNLLNYLIKYPKSILLLNPDFFISSLAQSIFSAIKNLSEKNITLNVRNISIESAKYTDKASSEVILSIYNLETSENEFDYLYRNLRISKSKENLESIIVNDIKKEIDRGNDLNLDSLIKFRDDLSQEIDNISGKESLLLTTNQWLDIYEKSLIERREGDFFFSTGDSDLDKHLTTAFEPGYFNILAGHSGSGKSTFALMLNNKQINRQIPSLRVSNEMTDISDMDRLIAQRNKIPISLFYPKRNSDEGIPDFVFEMVKAERQKLAKCKLFRYVYAPDFSLDDLEVFIKQAKREMGVNTINVCVDLLTKVSDFSGDNKASSYEDASNKIDTIAKKTNSSIFGVVQLRRPSGKITVNDETDLEKLRPQLEEIKNAGALAERSRIVLGMFRKKFFAKTYLKDDPILEVMEDIAEIDILKQNLGEIGGRVKYLFSGETASLYKYIEEV